MQMANVKIENMEYSLKVQDNKQVLMKRPLSIDSVNDVHKKKVSESTLRPYKVLLSCAVCEGDAFGYNFDAVTCESCKAFFRRNGKQSIEALKCRGNGHCALKFGINNRCTRCRLEKCFTEGMRKEWILTKKEKEEKYAKIEENRRRRQIHNDKQARQQLMKSNSKIAASLPLNRSALLTEPVLKELDWFTIRFIQDCYRNAIKLNEITGILSYPFVQPIDSTLDLFRIPLFISSIRLISYIKQTSEFQQLTFDDRMHLIKQNLLTVCFFYSIYMYDSSSDCYHDQNSSDPFFSGKDWTQTLNAGFHVEMKQLRNDLINIFQFDDIIIKLFLLILLLSNQMSAKQSLTCCLTDINSLDIFKAQDIFADLVYRYCVHQYGSVAASVLFARYIQKILKIQQLVDEMKHTIGDYMDVTRASSLMESLFS